MSVNKTNGALPAAENSRSKLLSIPATARWRIVGWIVLTTILMMLALILTARSIFIRQVHLKANTAIEQEVKEFNAFAAQAVDSRTRRPFASMTALMERYLERQTPDRGEAFIAVTPGNVLLIDNTANDAGERLASDRERLNALLTSPHSSGIEKTPDGPLRWGKSVVVGHTQNGRNGQRGVLLVAQFMQSSIDAVHRNILVLFGVMFGGLVLIASIAWLVAGQILSPIRRFIRLSDRIDPLNLQTRLPEDGSDELAQLARALNSMLDRLSSAHLEQRHVLYEVLQQIQSQVQALSQLRKQSTHDPALLAALDVSQQDMQRLLQDLELLIESGKPGFLHCQDVHLGEWIQQLAKHMRHLYPGHDWQVAETVNIAAPMDVPHVARAMQHLASNAAQHNPAGEPILLGVSVRSLATGERMASLWVANQGLPLSREEARLIFEPVVHKHDRLASNGPQMGMGLAVVKALAHAHGGYAWVQSGTEQGTVFGLDIPLVRLKEAAREEQVAEAALQAMQHEQ
ncbi:MAG: HAMP domain-containing sensor histidine kinase [Brachymonas sp.]|nr:HAMP domain-containing sensor histidine kinase [Brachymonas sp.]